MHKFAITLTPNNSATVASPSGPNLVFKYLDTVLFTDPSGQPVTGLDADPKGPYLSFPGFPDLPAATYAGNGFGGNGTGGHRVSIDSEGLILNADGTFWVSDEYGPFAYKFSAAGKMLEAIKPADALIPHRNGTTSYSANSAPAYNPNRTVIPADPVTGRSNK